MKKPTTYVCTACMVLTLLILTPHLFAIDQPDATTTGITRGPASEKLVRLGAISAENPTISHLLLKNAILKSHCWDIIAANHNRNKNYTSIQAGTEIYYHPETKALLWTDTITKNPKKAGISAKAPVAIMPETAFEFPPTVEGERVTHDFLIQNRGNADLTVLRVKTT